MLLVTTAMKPLSDFTTPRRLIAPISRHFFPVEQPEPPCCTTGLKNGSRFPLIDHFLSSGLGSLAALFAGTSGALMDATSDLLSLELAACFGCIGSALATTTAGLTSADLTTV